jgi:serine/threonine protein kinase
MTPERWKEIKGVFDAALERDPAERERFLASACEGDEELRREVDSLIAAQQDAGSRYDAPIVGEATDPMIGRHIGAYRLLRRIGTGGMGAVYLGSRDDAQFRRLAAVKVIRPELLDEGTRRRFNNERQTLAALEHPNIVKLLDGGTSDEGWPYLIMDYVEGQPIDKFVKERSLSINERLELFRTLCAAVHYAHQNLVVHRDLKPANILVTPQGVPKLLDFGIAKLLKPAYAAATVGFTRTNAQPMTPEYASPEQILGQPITTATDVYSLGVLLYTLLTDTHPYQIPSQSYHELELSICEGNPKKPSAALQLASPAAARQLRGDLDTIVLTAMRKEPQRRYSSAEHLAEDVRRQLHREPLAARPDTLLYRTQKFVARNKWSVSAAAVAVVLLGFFVVRDEIDRRRAEQRFQDLRKFANFVIQDLDKEVEKGTTPARKMLVGTALGYLDGLAAEGASDPSLKLDLIRGYMKVSDIQGNLYAANLGEIGAAEESLAKALKIANTLSARQLGDRETRRLVSRLQEKMGDLQRQARNIPATLELYNKALALTGDDTSSTARVLDRIAQIHAEEGDPAAALESERAALAVAEKGGMPAIALAFLREEIASFAMEGGEPETAENAIRGSIAVYEKDASTPKLKLNLAMAYKNLAAAEERAGKTTEALENCQRSLTISEELLSADPKNDKYSVAISQQKVLLIELLLKAGEKDAARKETSTTLAFLAPLVHSPESSNYAYYVNYVALLDDTPFPEFTNKDDAVAVARRYLAFTKGKDSESLDLLARALERQGNLTEAVTTERRALDLLPPSHEGRQKAESREKIEASLARMQTTALQQAEANPHNKGN